MHLLLRRIFDTNQPFILYTCQSYVSLGATRKTSPSQVPQPTNGSSKWVGEPDYTSPCLMERKALTLFLLPNLQIFHHGFIMVLILPTRFWYLCSLKT